MGTYTTNYQLYMPTVGEQGWGTLVNGNFETIDTTIAGLSTRLTAVENEVNGALSCTSVTTSGEITGNGGIAGTTGTFSGAVTGASFNGVVLKNSGTITVTPTSTLVGVIPKTYGDTGGTLTLLPYIGASYSGSIKFYGNSSCTLMYWNGSSYGATELGIGSNATASVTFSNIPFLVVCRKGSSTERLSFYGFALS